MKNSLRTTLLKRRHALSPQARQSAEHAIGEQILRWHACTSVITVGVYWPLRGEPNLEATYVALAEQGVQLSLPIVREHHAALDYVRWQPGEALGRDACGVPIPLSNIACAMPQALLIPCVGFNAEGFRLGYGGGYYDRTLAITPRPITLGIAFACTEEHFPVDAHDIRLDWIITEAVAAKSPWLPLAD